MFKKQCYLFIIWVLLVSASASSGDLIAWYKFDNDVRDSSGNGYHGTIGGAPVFVSGYSGQALRFDGANDYVDLSAHHAVLSSLGNFTLSMWAEGYDGTKSKVLFCWTDGTINQRVQMHGGGDLGKIGWLSVNSARTDAAWMEDAWTWTPGTWYHLAFVNDTTEGRKIYVNGVEMAISNGNTTASPSDLTGATFVRIANRANSTASWLGGIDEVRIYDRALAAEEIQQTMIVAPPGLVASNPIPADEATDVPRDVVLSWTPSEFADKHDVYFGTNLDDVNDATTTVDPAGVYMGSQDLNAYATARLDLGQTYYWRVDEVNAPPDFTVYKGDVWQFTVEPFTYPIAGENITATASSANSADEGPENSINGSGLDADDLHSADQGDMWLSNAADANTAWIQYEFDRVYELHQMRVWNHNSLLEQAFGLGVKDAAIEYSVDGADWTTLGTTHEFARAPGAAGYADNTTVDLSGVAAKYVKITANSNWGGIVTQYGLSEVRFLYIPVQAREPDPASGSTDIDVDNVTLVWRAGRKAAKHDVYLSTDEQAVIDETISPVSVPAGSSYASYDTGALDLKQTYYWKVNEVNEAESPATWQGDVWNFATQEYLVVDDFEQYDDTDNKIFDVWTDYFANNTGAIVGHFDTPFAEQDIVHSGSQSMPYRYDNDGAVNEGTAYEKTGTKFYSEAEREWAAPQDWTTNGAELLTLWFRGLPPLYGSFTVGPPMTMTARGAGIAGASDQFHFAYQQLSGDGSITARVVSLTNTNAAARAGVMIRETLAADAMHAMVAVTPTSEVTFLNRLSAGGTSATATTQAGIAAPQWIRLTRTGRTFTAEYSTNGTIWTALGTPLTMMYLPLSADFYVGLCLTAGTANATCTAEFSNVTTTGTLPGQWQSQDIGIASNVSADQLYVVLQDSANNSVIVEHPDSAATTIDTWTEWDIPLAQFTGVNPQTIKKMCIGVGDKAAPQAGGSGTMYIDDIRLYPGVMITPVAPDPDRLIASYKFENDVRDSSGNGYHGTIGGAPVFVSGYSGQALRFDANDYVDLSAHHAVLSSLGNFTLSMWAEGYDGTKGKVLFCWTDGTINQRIQMHGGGAPGRIGWLATGAATAWMEDAWTWTPGTWYHLAFVNDTTEGRKIYVNGVEMAISNGNTTASPSDLVGATFVRIANRANSAASWLGGIDEVRIYDKALSNGEILYLADHTDP